MSTVRSRVSHLESERAAHADKAEASANAHKAAKLEAQRAKEAAEEAAKAVKLKEAEVAELEVGPSPASRTPHRAAWFALLL